MARPFLKWAGGKTALLPKIREHVPEQIRLYHEPFVGAGAVFFDLCARAGRPIAASLGDNNLDLLQTYLTVKVEVEPLIERLAELEERYRSEDPKEVFLEVRAWDLVGVGGIPRATRTIFLNKTCFNGLWRTNRTGRFNTPWGQNPKVTICDADNLRACSVALREAVFNCEDFANEPGIAQGDFCYFDPPYWPMSKTANFVAYGPGGFGPKDQARLRDFALTLKGGGVPVLISNADCPEVRDLYRGFRCERVLAKRPINSQGDGRGEVGELLIW